MSCRARRTSSSHPAVHLPCLCRRWTQEIVTVTQRQSAVVCPVRQCNENTHPSSPRLGGCEVRRYKSTTPDPCLQPRLHPPTAALVVCAKPSLHRLSAKQRRAEQQRLRPPSFHSHFISLDFSTLFTRFFSAPLPLARLRFLLQQSLLTSHSHRQSCRLPLESRLTVS